MRLANSKRKVYRILHVRNVRTCPSVRFLPNPFDHCSKDRFDLDEAGFRVRYRTGESGDDVDIGPLP